MGMFSEIAAEGEAKRLEVVLKAAKDIGVDVAVFCKEHVYPLYLEAVDETWGSMKADPELVNYYEEVV